MSKNMLKFLLAFVGFISVIGASLIFALGPHAAFQIMSLWAELLTGPQPIVTDMNSISIDSELRFFSSLLFGFGCLLVHTAWTFPKNSHRVPYLLLVFVLGGVGRALSNITVATPNPFFVNLMWLEIIGPIIVYFIYRRAIRKTRKY